MLLMINTTVSSIILIVNLFVTPKIPIYYYDVPIFFSLIRIISTSQSVNKYKNEYVLNHIYTENIEIRNVFLVITA